MMLIHIKQTEAAQEISLAKKTPLKVKFSQGPGGQLAFA